MTLIEDSSQVGHLVAVMARLRGPGGCPWDGEQTHASLVQYCLEEAYEVAEAIETDDRVGLREELGDLLLQVVFHAEIARSEPDPFDLEDIAHDVAAKLIRRHPGVFAADGVLDSVRLDAVLAAADAGARADDSAGQTDDSAGQTALTAEASYVRWDQIKAAEKQRTSVLDGIPLAQSSLARTQKVIGRAQRGGLAIDPTAVVARAVDQTAATTTQTNQAPSSASADIGRRLTNQTTDPAQARADIGRQLVEIIVRAQAAGVDADGALRDAMRVLEGEIRRIETTPQTPASTTPGAPEL